MNTIEEYRDVDNALRVNIKALYDMVAEQGKSIRELEIQNLNKVARHEFYSEMQKKIDLANVMEKLTDFKKELRAEYAEVNAKVAEKISGNDLNFFLGQKVGKEEFAFSTERLNSGTEKLFKICEELQKENRDLYEKIEGFNMEIKSLARLTEVEDRLRFFKEKTYTEILDICNSQMQSKVDFEKCDEIEKSQKFANLSISKLQQQLSSIHQSFLEKINFQYSIEEIILSIAHIEQQQNIFSHTSEDLKTRIFSLESEKISFKDISETLKTTDEAIVKLGDSQCEMQEKLFRKVEISEFCDCFQELKSLISQNITSSDFLKCLEDFNISLEGVYKVIEARGSLKEAIFMLDKKANIDDVNVALSSIHNELDSKASEKDLAAHVSYQTLLNHSFSSEYSIGRWTWPGGVLLPNNVIPWETQVINTSPENFKWEKKSGTLIISQAGTYEVTFAFFFPTAKPNVQVLLNSEIIISAVSLQNYVIYNSTGKLRSYKASQISTQEFLVLPSRSHLSLTTSNNSGEAFISLKKLS